MEKKKQPPPEMPEYGGIKDLELDNSDETLAKFRRNNIALIYPSLSPQNVTVLKMLMP